MGFGGAGRLEYVSFTKRQPTRARIRRAEKSAGSASEVARIFWYVQLELDASCLLDLDYLQLENTNTKIDQKRNLKID